MTPAGGTPPTSEARETIPKTGAARAGALVTRGLHLFLGIVLLIVVAINVVNAVSRYALGVSPVGTDEAMIYLIIWMVMIGAVLSFFNRTHISVNVLPLYTIGRVRHLLFILQDLAAIFACAYASYASWLFIGRIGRIGMTSMGLGVPMTWPHSALLFGFVGLTIAGVVKLILDVAGFVRNAPHSEVQR
ncbi:MAG: TRAP transporter small permease subunit [Pseudomonadota bacterium]